MTIQKSSLPYVILLLFILGSVFFLSITIEDKVERPLIYVIK